MIPAFLIEAGKVLPTSNTPSGAMRLNIPDVIPSLGFQDELYLLIDAYLSDLQNRENSQPV